MAVLTAFEDPLAGHRGCPPAPEAGYDVEGLSGRMGPPARGAEASHVVPVRRTVEELAAVTARAEREHLNWSEAIAAALVTPLSGSVAGSCSEAPGEKKVPVPAEPR